MNIERAEMGGKESDAGITEHAERWLIRLDRGAYSPAELEAFERWRTSPKHAAAYEKAERFWHAFGQLSGRQDLERLSAKALADTAPGAHRLFARPPALIALAASFVICVVAVVAFFASQRYTPIQTYITDAGQRSTVQLDDGSQVILNFATRLDVKLGTDRRQFELKAGEAIFTVAEDPLRPFLVFAGNSEVTALGTRFQVRNDSEQVTVTLLEGRIAVKRGIARQHVQLDPGDQVSFAPNVPEMKRQTVDPGVVSSWTSGRLKFNATPLTEALEEVNRYSKTKIRLQDATFARTPVSGVFDIGDTASVVSALEAMLPVEAAIQKSGEIVLTRK